jgi:TatD DNase family protein
MFIDTHAHLDDKQFDADREEIIARSFANGVERIINIGAGLGSSERSVALAKKYENIYAAVGLHPEYFMEHGTWNTDHKNKLEALERMDKVTAIGEIGLDYYNHGEKLSEHDKEFQKEGFVYQLELAKDLSLPVILHCRGARPADPSAHREDPEAYADVLEIIKKYPKLDYVFHGYGGNLEFTRVALAEKNIIFSLAGNITYNKPGSEMLEVIKIIPLQKIMLDTDCPYLAPVPHRGERNEPAFVKFTAGKIAEIKNVSLDEVEQRTTENSKRFFRW